MDVDIHDCESPPDGVVRWVASQSPNPALQALMREAEHEKRTRPSTPVHAPMSWTYPLASTSSSTPLSASVASPWQPTGHSATDASYPLPLSGSSSSSSLAFPASEPSMSRRAKPLSAAQRKPLAASTSSTNQPLRDSAPPRTSSHSTPPSNPSTSVPKYIPQEEEPEAMAFIELLRDVSRQLDQNSEKKQRLAARTKEKERERSLGRTAIDSRTGLNANTSSARPLTKTSSASAICPVRSSTRPLETTFRTSMSALKPEPRGRVLEKTTSLSASGVDFVSGKSTPASLPRVDLNCDPKLAPIRTFNAPNTHPTAVRKATSSADADSVMQDIDLTDTDMEWEKPMSGPMSRTDTATYMQVDDDDSCNDTAMDTSFVQARSPPRNRVAAPKPKPHLPQPNTPSRPLAPTPRTRTGPPPLGMRRVPQHQPCQYGSSQGSKGVTVPRFRPPLLASAGGTNKSGSGKKRATTTNSIPPPRSGPTRGAVAETVARGSQDADSSFDVSLEVDADALEEAMKAYD